MIPDKTTHLFSNGIYLISSSACARNPIFYNQNLCKRFLNKMEYYLSPFCEILYYAFDNAEFQLILKIRDRKILCEQFKLRYSKNRNHDSEIPLTTYIFSKAMGDLLVSVAKHFNYLHQRKGSLFATRFGRTLIESQEDLDMLIDDLSKMKKRHIQKNEWAEVPKGYSLRKRGVQLRKLRERCARHYYEKKENVHEILTSFKIVGVANLNLRGYFKNLPPKSLQHKLPPFSTPKSQPPP